MLSQRRQPGQTPKGDVSVPMSGGKPRLQEDGQRHGGAGSAPGRRPGTSLPAQPLSHLDSVKRLRASLRGPVSATGRG